MPDFDNEEQFKETIKNSYKPATPSAEFQDRLHKLILTEVSQRRIREPRRLWAKPLLWASTAAAIVLIVLIFALWGQPDRPPVVMPEPSASPSITLPPSVSPSPELTPVPSPTPSTEPSAEPSPTPSASPPLMASTGTLEIRVTDAPPEREVSQILVTLSNIRVHKEIEGTEEEGEWVTVIEGPVSFDLIYLKEFDIEEILGDTELDVGYYTQMRMDITQVEAIVEGDEEVIFPSEVLKTASNFEIEEDKTTTLLFDFDAAKSLVFTGEGKVMFKPVVKLVVTGPE